MIDIDIKKLTKKVNKSLGYNDKLAVRMIRLNEEFIAELVERANRNFSDEQASNFEINIKEEGRNYFIKQYVMAESKRALAIACRRFNLFIDISPEELFQQAEEHLDKIWDKSK